MALAVDLGGTTISGGVMAPGGGLVGAVDHQRVSGTDGDPVLDSLRGMLDRLRQEAVAAGRSPVGVGVAVPGPFDYGAGVSHMRHKLRELRGVQLRPPLEAAARAPVFFCNDAVAFALGAWWLEYPDEPRLVGITLGTGLGSGFIVGGAVAGEEQGAPPGGEIWNLPYRHGILEDAVSRDAIERGYEAVTGERHEVAVIAERARSGDVDALSILHEYGERLGDGLARAVARFAPTRIVCGGSISKAFDLFGTRMTVAYAAAAGPPPPIEPVGNDVLALAGAALVAYRATGGR